MGKKNLLSAILACSLLWLAGSATSALAMDVTLAWDANEEADLAGYKLYYDTDSGHPYEGTGAENGTAPSPIDVPLAEDEDPDPLVVQYTVRNLPEGVHYFAVTAYNTQGHESAYSNEVSAGGSTPPPPNGAPSLSSFEVNGQTGGTTIYTNDASGQVDVRLVATDDVLVSQYLILDGDNDPSGEVFYAIPGGARQNPIFTVSDFALNNSDGNHTVYAWVKDDQGLISATATKTNIILDRVGPTVAISYSTANPFKAGDTVTVTANFADSNPISGTPTISINFAGSGSDLSGAAMTQVTNKQWRYAMTVPSANEGTATVTVAAWDAAGNAVGAHSGNVFVVDSASPGVAGFPSIDYTESSVTVTYTESGMKNASIAANYSFNNGLLLGGNGTDTSGTNKAFKFPLNPGTLQHNTVYSMQIGSAVTDSAGKAVSPNTARVNDDDNDGMADDWERQWFGSITAKSGSSDTDGDVLTDGAEYSYARSNPAWGADRWTLSPLSQDSDGDGIPDSYEVLSGLNPVNASDRDLDSDNDGWSNYDEFLYGTSASDPNSRPRTQGAIDVVEVIPLNNSGIPPSKERLPNNTAFAVRMESADGIDTGDPNAVVFSIDDGSNTYTRKLNDLNGTGSKILRAVPLDADGTVAYSLWAVYYRSNETALQNAYAYDATVQVTVSAKDRNGDAADPITFRFKIQGQESENAAKIKAPKLSTSTETASPSKKKSSVDSGELQGASVTYDSNLMEEIGLEPYIGPAEEIPPLNEADAAGVAVNLLPPAVFPEGVKVTIPCPGVHDVSALWIYYYDGGTWVPACDSAGNVLAGGEGWMVRGSRINHDYNKETGTPACIEIQVYHFSAAVAGQALSAGGGEAETGGGSCFISSLGGK